MNNMNPKIESAGGREEMLQEIDLMSVIALAEQIQEKALQGSVIAKKLQQDDISENERVSLGQELEEIIAEGSRLSSERARVEARYKS